VVNDAATGTETLKLEGLIRAGIELAAYELYELKLSPRLLTDQRIHLDEGVITISVTNEAGKIDLNWSDPALLAGAYQAAGLRPADSGAFAAAVVAWRGRYGLRGPGPASDQASRAVKPEGFRSVDELQFLPLLSADDVVALSPLLTVHNPEGKVDVLAAPDGVLSALPGVTPLEIDQIRSVRDLPEKQARDRLTQLLPRQLSLITPSSGGAFQVRIAGQLRTGAVRRVRVLLINSRTRREPYFLTDWIE
jgi:general secretion pathway protein K